MVLVNDPSLENKVQAVIINVEVVRVYEYMNHYKNKNRKKHQKHEKRYRKANYC